MFVRLLILFSLVPVLELALLIEVGQLLGLLPTVLVVLATGAAGAALARWQGVQAVAQLRQALASGAFPGEQIFDGALILGGGLLLLTPGFVTDLFGFAALLPGSRQLVKAYLKRMVQHRIRSQAVRVEYDVN